MGGLPPSRGTLGPFLRTKSRSMTSPLEVHFHGIEKSSALQSRVEEKYDKLKRHCERMTSCRVVLEAPHRNSAKAKVFQVKIEISIPGQKLIIVNHEREGAHAQEDLSLAIRDAFEAARRKVDEIATKMSSRARQDRGRRRPAKAPEGQDEE
jgi:ribosome-associated translation inhibitor RaiA